MGGIFTYFFIFFDSLATWGGTDYCQIYFKPRPAWGDKYGWDARSVEWPFAKNTRYWRWIKDESLHIYGSAQHAPGQRSLPGLARQAIGGCTDTPAHDGGRRLAALCDGRIRRCRGRKTPRRDIAPDGAAQRLAHIRCAERPDGDDVPGRR